jgi:hypothetical protein
MSKYQDTIIAALLVGFAGFVAYEASRIPGEFFQRAEGIVYYPLLLSVSLAVASLILLVRSLVRPGGATEVGENEEIALRRERGTGPGSEAEAEPGKESEGDTERELPARSFTARVLPVLLGIIILAAYVVALAMVGFIFSTPVMLVALLLAYGIRDWKIIASLSIGTTAVMFLIFYYALKVQLP